MNRHYKVNYLSRDFSSIKEDLKQYAKRYYADTMADDSEASINSFLIDSVAYVGDILSYYLDYQTNESFLDTAIETKNILSLAKTLGFSEKTNPSATGIISIYILVPDKDGSPDFSKVPIIKKGSEIRSVDGISYLLSENVHITEESVGNSWVVARVNTAGKPLFYAVKTYAPIISGKIITEEYTIGNYEKFKKLFLNNNNAVEIISVVDSEGNYFYEVSNLSQNIVYRSIYNPTDSEQKYMLKPIVAQRRFVFDIENGAPILIFGAKQYKPDEDLKVNPTLEPIKFSLRKYNNDYLSDSFFEPNALIAGDSYGFAPENTVLTISYRINEPGSSFASTNTITSPVNILTSYTALDLADPQKSTILNNIQFTNEQPVVGDGISIYSEDIKNYGKYIFAAQGRAVTSKDYEALCYLMPQKYGALKKVKVERDSSSLKNNINIYTICQDANKSLIKSNLKIKENLKTWLSEYKIITDTIDILDAKIVNFGIYFIIMVDPAADKLSVLSNVKASLVQKYSIHPEIGEAFNILDIYREIRKFNEVLDIKEVSVTNKTHVGYSTTRFSIKENLTLDGSIIKIPKNVIYEIKYPEQDISGDVI